MCEVFCSPNKWDAQVKKEELWLRARDGMSVLGQSSKGQKLALGFLDASDDDGRQLQDLGPALWQLTMTCPTHRATVNSWEALLAAGTWEAKDFRSGTHEPVHTNDLIMLQQQHPRWRLEPTPFYGKKIKVTTYKGLL